jgi:chromosome segregation and condensation protein ScpB
MNLASKIESLLFVSSKPLSTSQIAKYANGSEEEVRAALNTIATQRLESGIVLLEMNDTWQLATSPENVELVKTYLNADLRENTRD